MWQCSIFKTVGGDINKLKRWQVFIKKRKSQTRSYRKNSTLFIFIFSASFLIGLTSKRCELAFSNRWNRYIYRSSTTTYEPGARLWNGKLPPQGVSVGWLFGFYGISTFVGYLTPNHFYENSSISNNSV